MSHPTKHHRPSVSAPVAPRDRLQEIWSQLSAADRHAVLGHEDVELSSADRAKLVKVIDAVVKQRRRS